MTAREYIEHWLRNHFGHDGEVRLNEVLKELSGSADDAAWDRKWSELSPEAGLNIIYNVERIMNEVTR